MKFFFNTEMASILWTLVLAPIVAKLIANQVPKRITKLYENLAKYTQPAIDSLFKLKEKIKNSPNKIDDECFKIGVEALKAFNSYLNEVIAKLES